MGDEDLEKAYKQFKDSFSEKDWCQVSPKMFFEYGFLGGLSLMLKKIDIYEIILEDILYADSITHEINCIVLEGKDRLQEALMDGE